MACLQFLHFVLPCFCTSVRASVTLTKYYWWPRICETNSTVWHGPIEYNWKFHDIKGILTYYADSGPEILFLYKLTMTNHTQWRFTYILLTTLAAVRHEPMPLLWTIFNFFSKIELYIFERKLKSVKDRIRTWNLRSNCQSANHYTMEGLTSSYKESNFTLMTQDLI